MYSAALSACRREDRRRTLVMAARHRIVGTETQLRPRYEAQHFVGPQCIQGGQSLVDNDGNLQGFLRVQRKASASAGGCRSPVGSWLARGSRGREMQTELRRRHPEAPQEGAAQTLLAAEAAGCGDVFQGIIARGQQFPGAIETQGL